jgi:predicted nucleic acid-binding protein
VKIANWLSTVTLLGIDITPFIYFIEKNPAYFARMKVIMNHIGQSNIMGLSASLILTEVLSRPMQLGQQALVEEYEDILLNSHGFRAVAIDIAIAKIGAKLRSDYRLKTPDALHIATSIYHRCDAFLTNDHTLKRVKEINIVVLDDLEI